MCYYSIIPAKAIEFQLPLYKAIVEQMNLISSTLTSAKGIIPVYSAGIIVIIDDIKVSPISHH